MICIAGKNRLTIQVIDLILDRYPKIELCIIHNTTDDGIDNWQPSVKKKALELDIPLVTPNDIKDVEDLVLLSLEYDKLLKPETFISQKLLNIHFSILPKYKGQFTSSFPILNGETESGVTLHIIDAGVDTGEIVDQVTFPIKLNHNAKDVYLNYMDFAVSLVEKNLENIINWNIQSKPQPLIGSSFNSIKKIDYANLAIDLKQTAYEIHNELRAFTFREYQLPIVFGYKIYKSILINERSDKKWGYIYEDNIEYLIISSIDYRLKLFKDYFDTLLSLCEKGDIIGVKECMPYIENVNQRNNKGWSPLIVAAYNGHLDICEYLLNNGADIQLTNYKGTTVLMYAKSYVVETKDFLIMDFLISKGASIYSKDSFGKSILDYAKLNNQTFILERLNEML